MKTILVAALALLGVSSCGAPPVQPPSEAARLALAEASRKALAAGETRWMTVNGLRLKTKVYSSSVQDRQPALLLVLHGDSPNTPPSIQDVFAQAAAERLENVIAVGVLRPGYSDGAGDRSDGERGRATGDNYTPEVVDAIGELLRELKHTYAPHAAVLVGHSGGAAIAANMLARSSAAGPALLVSCPCNVPAWRRHMMRTYFPSYGPLAFIFVLPTESLSPLTSAGDVAPRSLVRMIVGEDDVVAPPRFSHEYATALRSRGVDVGVRVVPGLGHDIFLEPVVFDDLRRLVASTATGRPE